MQLCAHWHAIRDALHVLLISNVYHVLQGNIYHQVLALHVFIRVLIAQMQLRHAQDLVDSVLVLVISLLHVIAR